MNTAQSTPHIIAQMVKECWAIIGKPLRTTRQLEEDLDQIRQYFSAKLQTLDRSRLLNLCLDYLLIHDYKVSPLEDIKGLQCARLLSMLPGSLEIQGLVIFALREKQEDWLRLVDMLPQQPEYGFFIVFAPGIAGTSRIQSQRNITVVGHEDLFRTFSGIVLQEYFSLSCCIITSIPGFKERMFKIIEEKTGLLWDDLQKLHKEWVKMIGKY